MASNKIIYICVKEIIEYKKKQKMKQRDIFPHDLLITHITLLHLSHTCLGWPLSS